MCTPLPHVYGSRSFFTSSKADEILSTTINRPIYQCIQFVKKQHHKNGCACALDVRAFHYGLALQTINLHFAVPSEVEYDITKDISISLVNMTQTSAFTSLSDTVKSSDVIIGTE